MGTNKKPNAKTPAEKPGQRPLIDSQQRFCRLSYSPKVTARDEPARPYFTSDSISDTETVCQSFFPIELFNESLRLLRSALRSSLPRSLGRSPLGSTVRRGSACDPICEPS